MIAGRDKIADRDRIAKARDPAAPTAPETRLIRVSDLMQDNKPIILEHGGESYILRITAKGKLILTK
jgi:hemin uptake protein HemP